jgi:hypothetical protein
MAITGFVTIEEIPAGDVRPSNGWVLLAFGLLERFSFLVWDRPPFINVQSPPS